MNVFLPFSRQACDKAVVSPSSSTIPHSSCHSCLWTLVASHPRLHEVLAVVQVLRERALEVSHDSVPLKQE